VEINKFFLHAISDICVTIGDIDIKFVIKFFFNPGLFVFH